MLVAYARHHAHYLRVKWVSYKQIQSKIKQNRLLCDGVLNEHSLMPHDLVNAMSIAKRTSTSRFADVQLWLMLCCMVLVFGLLYASFSDRKVKLVNTKILFIPNNLIVEIRTLWCISKFRSKCNREQENLIYMFQLWIH